MNFKFEQKKPEQIVKGIYTSGIVYVASLICTVLATMITIFSNNGMFQTEMVFQAMTLFVVLANILKPIAIILFIKAICEALYNLLKAIEIYMSKNQEGEL